MFAVLFEESTFRFGRSKSALRSLPKANPAHGGISCLVTAVQWQARSGGSKRPLHPVLLSRPKSWSSTSRAGKAGGGRACIYVNHGGQAEKGTSSLSFSMSGEASGTINEHRTPNQVAENVQSTFMGPCRGKRPAAMLAQVGASM